MSIVESENEIIASIKNPLRLARYKISCFIDDIRGVDFNRQVNVENLGFSNETGNRYHAVTRRFIYLLRSMRISYKDVIVDLGCGKGKALQYMGRYRFGRIIGVELSKDLSRIAIQNMKKIGMKDRVELYNCNAEEWSIPHDLNYIFMFNPFPANVLRNVLIHVNDSISINNRVITIIYLQPVYHDVLIEQGFKMIRYWKNYAIYQNV